MQDQTPAEQLPPPIKMTGIGNAHMAITANAAAEAWFDQSLRSRPKPIA
jgi:hypothetical protein